MYSSSICFRCFHYCHAVPRYLPSFPTRRSSDLPGGAAVGRLVQATPRSLVRRVLLPRRAARLVQRGVHDSGIGRIRRQVEDRKSTRLNSSHTVISYAVFCLKKKTKSEQDDKDDT